MSSSQNMEPTMTNQVVFNPTIVKQTMTHNPLVPDAEDPWLEKCTPEEALDAVNELKAFLIDATTKWDDTDPHPLRIFRLPTNQYITCIKWQDEFYITLQDITRCLSFRLRAFGCKIDRGDAMLNEIRRILRQLDTKMMDQDEILALLRNNSCIFKKRPQLFYFWQRISHDHLFLRFVMGEWEWGATGIGPPMTTVAKEPALTFSADNKMQPLFIQVVEALPPNLLVIPGAKLLRQDGRQLVRAIHPPIVAQFLLWVLTQVPLELRHYFIENL